MTKRLIYFFFGALALALVFCTRDLPDKAVPTDTYKNLSPGVAYVGMQTCKSCHANVHSTFIHTGMGRSFDRATREKTDAKFGAHAVVYDEASDLYYHPFFRDSQMYVLEYRLEGLDTVHQRLEKIDYIVGSGQHTNSHMVDFNGYLYQAPVTYYTQEDRWDMAPGFRGDNIRFSRLLSAECITCHNHLPEQVPGSMNKYVKMPTGIECERCHGPGEIHAREKLAGEIVDTSKFIDYSIVNPRDLSRDLQMDLCQRCHLQGIAVLQDDKSFYDFKPGMRLSEVFNVFLPRYTDSHEKFIMASQADRLRLSACYLNSEMTCITCHNPHKSIEVTGRDQYNNACKNCHDGPEESACAFPLAERLPQGNDCSGCHMPRSGSIDIPHVNITDHYISKETTRTSKKEQPAAQEGVFLGLEILTKESGTALEMANGYLAMYDKYVQSPMVLDSAWAYLQRSKAPEAEQFPVEVHYFFAREDYSNVLGRSAGKTASEVKDAWTAYRIGEAFYQAGEFRKAVNFYRRADELLPFHLDFKEKLGAALVQLRQLPEAEEVLSWVIREHPKRPRALSNFGFARVLQGHTKEAEAYYDRAIALDPDYIQALLNKAAVRLLNKDYRAVAEILNRVLRLDPEHPQAIAILQQLNQLQ
ncbi:tetratricopeptide repeat protein [Phaeodactylibacter sp.]|uniref:tetratricopeptide repeat protein n=1 Tax=Phaeodactylibacter sp. TaxID=1940289 RepID=UPI0025E5C38B|nr:tetratricopeptide repeat protein [Phaeodactylibacter sp.]MCI4648565.1 tetratricopeptide repeat protein [Phaeodactylibacter sp.]MCI5091367.1 tetratricopeptide repeat protein [Phaeodactylibacter sp.]